ncbi:LPO_1073/Vpar_1526 family protein [Micromonospora chalcea]|uniref:LPO_1073/Vpar_1526 family protein n=1 Tax=Micromonospora chalcea TaxID=1874 RepID=UPI0037A97905
MQGVTEERAAEIAEYKAQQAIQNFASDAKRVAEDRISRFDQRLIAEMAAKGMLETFSDPGFQILLNRAQVQAAASGEQGDCELLSRLLVQRAANKRKPVHLAVSRATDAIDSLSEEALTGLTFLWLTLRTAVTVDDPVITFAIRNMQYESLLQMGPLPNGRSWLHDLDLLDLARVNYSKSRTLKAFDDLIIDNRPGLFSRGLSVEEAQEARVRLGEIGDRLPELLVPHRLLPGQFRFSVSTDEDREVMAKNLGLSSESTEALGKIFADYSVNLVDPTAREKAIEHIAQLPSYSAAREWFNRFHSEMSIDLTSPGIAIGYSNAGRFMDLSEMGTLSEVIERST